MQIGRMGYEIIKDIRELSFPASVFHKELDLKLISDELKTVPRKRFRKRFHIPKGKSSSKT